MNKGLVIAIVAVVIVVGAVLIMKGGSKEAAPPPPPPPPETPAPAPPAPPAQPAEVPAAAAPAAGGTLDAQTLVGTEWKYEQYSFRLDADGKLMVNNAIPGTWKVDGSALTASALGQTVNVTIQGDQLLSDGKPLTRVK